MTLTRIRLSRSSPRCDAFKKTEYKKFSFPTGDGIAIVFLTNPELPLQLGIQMYAKLREHNRGRSIQDQLDVRIGLASGPVFMVNDINNSQNVWRPGIILARRVMDIGKKPCHDSGQACR